MRYSVLLATVILLIGTPPTARGQSVEDLIADLSANNAKDRARAACQLNRLRSNAAAAVPALIQLLGDETSISRDVCRDIMGSKGRWRNDGYFELTTPGRQAADALGEIGRSALGPLHTALRDGGPNVRRNATRAVGEIEDQRSIAPLSDVLSRDTSEDVRSEAAWALGAIEDPRAVSALTRALANDSSSRVRDQSAWALGAIEDPSAVPALIAALSDPVGAVRENVAWALGAIEDPRGVRTLTTALDDPDALVRSSAAWALGSIGDENAVDALIAHMDDPDVEVRRMIVWALGAID